MAISGTKIASLAFPPTGIEKLKEQTPGGLDAEKARLKKATKEFESFFMYQLLKTMRKTIPKSTLNENAPFSGDVGKDVFTDMFDMRLAEKMITGDQGSLSEILYKSLVRIVEAEHGQEITIPLKALKPAPVEQPQIELSPAKEKNIEREKEEFEIKPAAQPFLPVATRPKAVKPDTILARFGQYINEAAEMTSLDPALIISVIKAESNGDPEAVSSAGAKGLMQLADSTAADYGVTEVFDPKENIIAGSRFLKDQLDQFGSLKLALAAYNAGPSNVRRYGGIPPFAETREYVDKVIDSLNTLGVTGPNAKAKADR